MSVIQEVARGYRLAISLTHRQRVVRLYRRSLRLAESWTADRELYLQESARLRRRFDDNAKLDASTGSAARLLREGEEEAESFTHPDPYTGAFLAFSWETRHCRRLPRLDSLEQG